MADIESAFPRLLADIEAGELIKKSLAREGIAAHVLRTYLTQNPARKVEWDTAKEASAVAFMEEALEVARNPGDLVRDEHGEIVLGKDGKPLVIAFDSAHARTRIDTLKWAARLRNPREYSDKQQLDVNVRTVDLTRIIEAANARLANGRAPRILEHDQGHATPALELIAQKALADLL